MSDLNRHTRMNFNFENHLRPQNNNSIEFGNTVGDWKWGKEKSEEETADMEVGDLMMDDDMFLMVDDYVIDPLVNHPTSEN